MPAAISSGVHPHLAWLRVNGRDFLISHGSCVQEGTRQSSTFQATLPLYLPGAKEALANIGDNNSGVVVESNGKKAVLVMGEIDTTTFHIGQNGNIVVTGRDNSIKLHNRIHHGNFTDHTTVGIVSELAGLAGLGFSESGSGIIAGEKISDEFVEMVDGQTFASIITKMAEIDDARWWVDNNSVLHYEIKPEPSGDYSVTYQPAPPYEKGNFFELSIKRNVQAGKTIEVTLKSFRESENDTIEGTGTVEGNGGPVQYAFQLPNQQQDQATHYAQSKADEIARHELTVNARVVGDVDINVDMGLAVNGTGLFDQNYLIDSIAHQFGMQGHTMTITARAGKGGRGA